MMAYGNQTVWIATENSPRISLYHATTGEFLMEIDLKPIVLQSLQREYLTNVSAHRLKYVNFLVKVGTYIPESESITKAGDASQSISAAVNSSSRTDGSHTDLKHLPPTAVS
ncbi:hypothetical protein CRM22_011221 [Opisthorchis felineus]|uniref:Uncharacterized protein n=1 Tax=Opisthorchis felineus TaxID=147828 RepID=A0A4S2K0Y6_OPIFE|nr:hypothetical protein CRM22_011221 [Opisthorchis felineus]